MVVQTAAQANGQERDLKQAVLHKNVLLVSNQLNQMRHQVLMVVQIVHWVLKQHQV